MINPQTGREFTMDEANDKRYWQDNKFLGRDPSLDQYNPKMVGGLGEYSYQEKDPVTGLPKGISRSFYESTPGQYSVKGMVGVQFDPATNQMYKTDGSNKTYLDWNTGADITNPSGNNTIGSSIANQFYNDPAFDTTKLQEESDAQAKLARERMEASISSIQQSYDRQRAQAQDTYKELEGTSNAVAFRLGQSGTPYDVARQEKEAKAKLNYFNSLDSEMNGKINELKLAYEDNDLKRVSQLRSDIRDIQTAKYSFLQEDAKEKRAEAQDAMNSVKEEREASKPFSVGDKTYQLNPQTGQYEVTAQQGISLSQGESYYNPQTGEVIENEKVVTDEPMSVSDIQSLQSMGYNISYGMTKGEVAQAIQSGQVGQSQSEPTPEQNKFLQGKTQQQIDAFNGLNDIDKANVMSLINGDVLLSDVSKGIGGALTAKKYNALASQIDPIFSENVNKQRYAFKQNWNNPQQKAYAQRTAINTALGHLNELKYASDALGDATLLPYKKLVNYINKNIGKPEVSNFNIIVTALAGELASVYKGGTAPTDQETKEWRENILASMSKSQINGVVKTASELISKRLLSANEEYKKVMGQYPDDQIVDQYTLDELKKSKVDVSSIEKTLQRQAPIQQATDLDSLFNQFFD